MIPTIRQSAAFRWSYRAYIFVFFIYLALPLIVVSIFAFNDSLFPSLPWEGFTWDWFFGTERPRLGVFNERPVMRSIWTSLFVAGWVAVLSVIVGTCNAFLFERYNFRFKNFLYVLMLLPLVIPGIILGISILVFSNFIANNLENATGLWFDSLRPGLPLVILGQFSFITTITSLVITARTMIEKEPNYTYVAARLLCDTLRAEALSFLKVAEAPTQTDMNQLYAKTLPAYIASNSA